jgi:hypothetical protein
VEKSEAARSNRERVSSAGEEPSLVLWVDRVDGPDPIER